MLYQPERHEALAPIAWDEARARATIQSIFGRTVRAQLEGSYWPWHPNDLEPGDDPSIPALPLYHGAAGVIWALHYLQDVHAAAPEARFGECFESLVEANRAALGGIADDAAASFLIGELPILLMAQGEAPTQARADRLATLIERNLDHPARELMWGSPGTMLAAAFLFEKFGDARWAELYRRTAARLWSQLQWSEEHACRYWTQDLYGRRSTYLDAVHGFVASASVLIRGRDLMEAGDWLEWAPRASRWRSRTTVAHAVLSRCAGLRHLSRALSERSTG
jgi:hypothetical protein